MPLPHAERTVITNNPTNERHHIMEALLNNVTVRRIQGRESADPVTGEVTRFVSFTLANDGPYCWAFADDLTELPPTGEPVNLSVSVRAKKHDNGARLSVRVLSWTLA